MENAKIFEKEFSKHSIKLINHSKKFDKIGMKKINNLAGLKNHETPDKSEYRKLWKFKNGYGISVIRGFGTYGANKGLFEIGVFKGDDLCYTTKITSDVIGFLTAKQVLRYGKRIMKLKE